MNMIKKYWKVGYATVGGFMFGGLMGATSDERRFHDDMFLRLLICTIVAVSWPLSAIAIMKVDTKDKAP